jgi:superfamily II DNA or RNA helicase
MRRPRDYQLAACNGNDAHPGILPALEKNLSAICVMATGLGKTFVLSKVAHEWHKGNVLLLAHRIELVDQMADAVASVLGYRPVVEQGDRGIEEGSLWGAGSIVVGSVQSMISARRKRKFKYHPFGLVIIDECHRAVSPSYVNLIDYYREIDPECRVLGMTATPNRSDDTALGIVFNSVAFEMGILDGIEQGWLCNIEQKFATVAELTLDKIPLKRNEFGQLDYSPADLERFLVTDGPLMAMSKPVLDSTQNGEQAIIFTASVAHAHQWAAALNHLRPGCAGAVDGTMSKGEGGQRTETMRAYKEGKLQFLLNFNIATEGFDAPNTSYVIMGRPTKSQLVYTQMLGRGTRPLPGTVDGLETAEERKAAIAASRKPFATVLDFVGNSRHQAVTAADILGGNYDVDIRRMADELIGNQGKGNVQDALKKGQALMLLEQEEERRRPMRDAIADAEIDYVMEDVDPFGGGFSGRKVNKPRGGATDAQVKLLCNFGVAEETAQGYSKRQASAVISDYVRTRCTISQAKTLTRYGYDPKDYTYHTAKILIDEIRQNGWRRPDYASAEN